MESNSELTVRSVVLGVFLSMLLAGSNAYLGLFAGMTVSASIPAAVLSMGIFRLFRRSSILENNIVQTSASAGESLAAGAIFTLPALLILGFWKEIHIGWVMLLCGLGGVLGVLFTIPLRRSLILHQKLQFPEGVATAEVLETGQTGGRGLVHIIQAAAAGGVFKLGSTALGVWPATIETARQAGQSILYGGMNLSPGQRRLYRRAQYCGSDFSRGGGQLAGCNSDCLGG
jgi:putative OPT family oligopeptide transporter